MLEASAHVVRIVVCSACSVALAFPAAADEPRPYQGPTEVETREREPTSAIEPLEAIEPLDASVPAEVVPAEVVPDDDDATDDEAFEGEDFAVSSARRDWRDEPEGEAASKRIRGGIFLTSGGLALIVGSVLLGTADPCRRITGNGCQESARARAALTMGIPGAAILAAGATLLALGIAKRRRIVQGMAPQLGRHGVGITLVGRF